MTGDDANHPSAAAASPPGDEPAREANDDALEADAIRAAMDWLAAKRAWEETARMNERPPDLSRIKRNVRIAERELRQRLETLERKVRG